jgi:hypothetical protein
MFWMSAWQFGEWLDFDAGKMHESCATIASSYDSLPNYHSLLLFLTKRRRVPPISFVSDTPIYKP